MGTYLGNGNSASPKPTGFPNLLRKLGPRGVGCSALSLAQSICSAPWPGLTRQVMARSRMRISPAGARGISPWCRSIPRRLPKAASRPW